MKFHAKIEIPRDICVCIFSFVCNVSCIQNHRNDVYVTVVFCHRCGGCELVTIVCSTKWLTFRFYIRLSWTFEKVSRIPCKHGFTLCFDQPLDSEATGHTFAGYFCTPNTLTKIFLSSTPKRHQIIYSPHGKSHFLPTLRPARDDRKRFSYLFRDNWYVYIYSVGIINNSGWQWFLPSRHAS